MRPTTDEDEDDVRWSPEEALIQAHLEDCRGTLEYLCAHLDSPIERLLLLAMFAPPLVDPGYTIGRRHRALFSPAPVGTSAHPIMRDLVGMTPRFIFPEGGWRQHGRCYLLAQPETKIDGHRRRFDFAIVSIEIDPPIRIVIECDGHDYHERTKEQAAKDRGTDRALQLLGWTVLRFTGSEIHADASACADDVHYAMALGAERAKKIQTSTPAGV